MTTLTNKHDIPLFLAAGLAWDDYDYDDDPQTISVSTLIKATKQILLQEQVEEANKKNPDINLIDKDVSDFTDAFLGRACHAVLEGLWKNKTARTNSLNKLKVPKRVQDSIVVAKTPSEVSEDDTPVYLENRAYKTVNGFKISGKYDSIFDGVVQDLKVTSVYKYMNPVERKKYILQGSFYRWLNPEKVTQDYMQILFIFKDWKGYELNSKDNYPPAKAAYESFDLMSIEATQQYAEKKLNELTFFRGKSQDKLPECTDDDLWRTDDLYQYFTKPENKRATANFTQLHEANKHLQEKGKGIVVVKKGKVKACKYCSALPICKQAASYIETGELDATL